MRICQSALTSAIGKYTQLYFKILCIHAFTFSLADSFLISFKIRNKKEPRDKSRVFVCAQSDMGNKFCCFYSIFGNFPSV